MKTMNQIRPKKMLFESKDSFFERVVTPFSITVTAFLGFCIYIFEYLFSAIQVNLIIVSSVICFLGGLLIFRKHLRLVCKTNKKPHFKKTRSNIIETPDEIRERKQRRIDQDSYYYGMIIFILSSMYLVFLEVI